MKQELPKQWRWVPLGTVLNRQRNLINPSDEPDRKFDSIGLEDIGSDGTGEVCVHAVVGSDLASAKAQFIQGDLLYGRLRPYLNKVAIAPCDGVSSTEIWVLRLTPAIDTEFAFWIMTSRYMLKRLERVTEGANLPRVDASGFDRIEIPVPPMGEQRRIVEILNKARDVRRFRQQADDLTTQLIPAIFNEMFGHPDRLIFQPLARLWRKPPQNGLYKHSDHYGVGTRIVRIGDFYDGEIDDIDSLQRLSLTDKEKQLYSLLPDDILVNRVNSIDFLGKSAICPPLNEPAVFESNMMRFSIDRSRVLPQFLIAYLQHPIALHELRRRAKHAVNQASINQTDLGALPIPVLPLEQQKRFVDIFMEVQEITSREIVTAPMLSALTQSLLTHAFSGDLTADWREANHEQLSHEVTDRDQWLFRNGVKLTATDYRKQGSANQTEGLSWELNSDQKTLLEQIYKLDRNDNGGMFTLSSLKLTKLLDKLSSDAIRRHLDVLASRGLIKAISRRTGAGGSVNVGFGNAYRVPLSDEEIVGTGDQSDYARISELDRLSKQGRAINVSIGDSLTLGGFADVSVTHAEGDE
jgi:type I restriction enzyme S subunit